MLFASGCSGQQPLVTPTPSLAIQSSTTSGDTMGGYASTGKTVYSQSCARCHGDSGQGVTAPALIGAGASLGKYTTAQGLLNFIKVSMPFNAPGSLSQQQYSQVLAYLLLQNGFASSGAPFDANGLNNLQLKK